MTANYHPAVAPSQLAYTVQQAASLLGIGRTTLYTLVQTGDLAPVKIRRRTLFRHDDLVAILDRNVAHRKD